MTWLVLTSSAANSEVVPWRVSSCVRRSICPGRMGSSGCVRSSAWICAFSSIRSWRFAPEAGVPAATLMAEAKRDGQGLLTAAATRAAGPSPPWQFLRQGKPSEEIIAAAREWAADLIVLGTHGRSGVARAVLGSSAEAAVRHAPCPVIVVRGGVPAS
jgi:nucleotide-binding universal stress UspA family protein